GRRRARPESRAGPRATSEAVRSTSRLSSIAGPQPGRGTPVEHTRRAAYSIPMRERSLSELDLKALVATRQYFPSPGHWEDEVIYFLMLDRFSDGKENRYRDNQGVLVTDGATPPFTAADNGNAVGTDMDAARWREAGTRFVGGTLSGLESKL